MSKTLGKILQIATIVVAPFAAPLVMVGLAVASFANALLMPKQRQQARQASVATLTVGETAREAIVGDALASGSIRFCAAE
jgi:hypothetical protein